MPETGLKRYPVCFDASGSRGRGAGTLGEKVCLAGGEPVTQALRSREAILAELASLPVEFDRLVVRPYDRETLIQPAADGGWGVVEILPHLRDWESIYFDRARAIVEEDSPRLMAQDDSLWAIERDYRSQNPANSLAELSEMRERLVAFLSDLPPGAWERTGHHSAFGEITLHVLMNQLCDHDREHLDRALDAVVS